MVTITIWTAPGVNHTHFYQKSQKQRKGEATLISFPFKYFDSCVGTTSKSKLNLTIWIKVIRSAYPDSVFLDDRIRDNSNRIILFKFCQLKTLMTHE